MDRLAFSVLAGSSGCDPATLPRPGADGVRGEGEARVRRRARAAHLERARAPRRRRYGRGFRDRPVGREPGRRGRSLGGRADHRASLRGQGHGPAYDAGWLGAAPPARRERPPARRRARAALAYGCRNRGGRYATLAEYVPAATGWSLRERAERRDPVRKVVRSRGVRLLAAAAGPRRRAGGAGGTPKVPPGPRHPRLSRQPSGVQMRSTLYLPLWTLMMETGLGGTIDGRV